jgi:hypothetical protein
LNYLNNVPGDKAFRLGEKSINNLYGLLFEFRTISDESYKVYADEEHNYFADWVYHVIGHHQLADELRGAKSRADAVTVLENAIKALKEPEPVAEVKGEEASPSFTMAKPAPKKRTLRKPKPAETPEEPEKEIVEEHAKEHTMDTETMWKKLSENKQEIKNFLWKHFAWDMAKEFMYGLSLGILVGLVLSKMFLV